MRPKVVKFSEEKLLKELMREAKALNIQSGGAEIIAKKTVQGVKKWAERRTMITESDLNRAIAKEIEKYNADLAYVYKNRGKII